MKTTTIALFGVILAIAGPLTCGDVASASRAPREGGGLDLTPRKPMWAFDCRSLRTVNGRAVLLGEMSWRADGDAISVSLVRASRSAYLFAIVLDASTGSRRRSFVLKRGGPTHTWNPTGRLLAARRERSNLGGAETQIAFTSRRAKWRHFGAGLEPQWEATRDRSWRQH